MPRCAGPARPVRATWCSTAVLSTMLFPGLSSPPISRRVAELRLSTSTPAEFPRCQLPSAVAVAVAAHPAHPLLPPSAATLAAPSEGPDAKVKKKDSDLPTFPALPDEKEIEKWFKELLKAREQKQQEGGGPVLTLLMASSLAPEQATNNSMGFYVVLNAADDLNGDGVPDGMAAQHGVNPLNDLTQTQTATETA